MHRHWLRHFPIGRHKNSVSRALLVLDQLLLLQVERWRNGSAPKLGDPLFLALTSRPQIARFRRSPGSNSLIKHFSQHCQWWIVSKSILWVRPKQAMSAFARGRWRADFLSHSSKSFSCLTEIRFSSLSGRRFALLGLLEVSSRPLPGDAGLVPFGQDYFYFSETKKPWRLLRLAKTIVVRAHFFCLLNLEICNKIVEKSGQKFEILKLIFFQFAETLHKDWIGGPLNDGNDFRLQLIINKSSRGENNPISSPNHAERSRLAWTKQIIAKNWSCPLFINLCHSFRPSSSKVHLEELSGGRSNFCKNSLDQRIKRF